MVRAWRRQAGWLLVAYVVLDVLGFVYTRTAGASLNARQPVAGQLIWLALDGLLVWRIWRGGRIAWAVLVFLTGALLILALISAVWPFPPYFLGFLAIIAVQTTLLLSPAVRDHVRSRPLRPG